MSKYAISKHATTMTRLKIPSVPAKICFTVSTFNRNPVEIIENDTMH